MDSTMSSTYPASTDSTLAPGASDAPSRANAGNSPSQRPTGTTPGALPGSLAGLTPRNRPETGPAHDEEHEDYIRTGLSGLPPEIVGLVANNLPPRGVIAFADTCHNLRYALAEEKRGATLIDRASRARAPGKAMELLREIQTDISSPALRATALATLVMTIEPPGFIWPSLDEQQPLIPRWAADSEHTALYDSAWTAIRQLPLQYQAEPLASFAPSLCELPDVQQSWDRFDAFLYQIVQLPPEHRAGPLAAFAQQIYHLNLAKQQAKYDAVLMQVPQLPAEHRRPVLAALGALAPFMAHLPEPAAKFDALFEATRQLPGQDQGPMLELLALTLRYLPEPRAKFGALVEATRQLPAQDQAPTLSRLAPSVLNLPWNDQPAAFEHVMQIIKQLRQAR
jgi:hypothetical protein